MPLVDAAFPQSAEPGQRPGEGTGDLINCYFEVGGKSVGYRPSPGFSEFIDTTESTPRGMFVVNGLLYAAYEDTVVTVTTSAVKTTLTGTLSGTTPVTWAQNNKSPTADVVVVSENGAFSVSTAAVTSFADSDLPQPNSCAVLDGFILFTTRSGQLWATDLNAVTVNALSFTQCQANPDGLWRVIVKGPVAYAMGDKSIEPYTNAGTSPFPLARQEVIPVGLLSAWAVAGHEDGWDRDIGFVASDQTVRMLSGNSAQIISNKDVERDIKAVVDKTQLRASVYVEAGNPFWVLTGPTFTWEFNVATGFWNRRESANSDRWRASCSVNFNGSWMVGDRTSGQIHTISENVFQEDGDAIAMTMVSGPLKQFPSRVRCNAFFADWTTGQGEISGSDDEVNPKVSVYWSMDGGATWSNPITPLSLGGEGEFSNQIRVNRLGNSTHHGIRFKMVTTSPVYRTCRGARADVTELRAA
jgi:hypothetical protein